MISYIKHISQWVCKKQDEIGERLDHDIVLNSCTQFPSRLNVRLSHRRMTLLLISFLFLKFLTDSQGVIPTQSKVENHDFS